MIASVQPSRQERAIRARSAEWREGTRLRAVAWVAYDGHQAVAYPSVMRESSQREGFGGSVFERAGSDQSRRDGSSHALSAVRLRLRH
jgi:hypothetical protein